MATSSVFALTRVHPGFYKTEIGGVTVHVTKHTGRSWSASRGSHAWTKWSAVVPALIPEVLKTDGAHESEIAQGSTLAQCRKHLERYAADFAAGALGRRHRYGFHGDNRYEAVPGRDIDDPRRYAYGRPTETECASSDQE